MTLYFLDDVFLLNLTLKPAKCVLERFAFLNTNFCQKFPPPDPPSGTSRIVEIGNLGYGPTRFYTIGCRFEFQIKDNF
jgi:hypothetical protein